jgi:cobalamin biosynthesis protein CobD/CbiB
MLAFLLAASRAIVEMLLYCLLGQALLYLLAGQRRAANPIYQLLALITRAPRQICARVLPTSSSGRLVGAVCFTILVVLWLFLSWLRNFH